MISALMTTTHAGGDKCDVLLINSNPNNPSSLSPLPVCELCLNGITRQPCGCPPNTSKFMSFETPHWFCCTTEV